MYIVVCLKGYSCLFVFLIFILGLFQFGSIVYSSTKLPGKCSLRQLSILIIKGHTPTHWSDIHFMTQGDFFDNLVHMPTAI